MLHFRAYFAWKDLERDKNCKLLHISELQNLGVDITAPNSTLHYENLPELPLGFLGPHPFPNTPIIKDKRILVFCGKIAL